MMVDCAGPPLTSVGNSLLALCYLLAIVKAEGPFSTTSLIEFQATGQNVITGYQRAVVLLNYKYPCRSIGDTMAGSRESILRSKEFCYQIIEEDLKVPLRAFCKVQGGRQTDSIMFNGKKDWRPLEDNLIAKFENPNDPIITTLREAITSTTGYIIEPHAERQIG